MELWTGWTRKGQDGRRDDGGRTVVWASLVEFGQHVNQRGCCLILASYFTFKIWVSFFEAYFGRRFWRSLGLYASFCKKVNKKHMTFDKWGFVRGWVLFWSLDQLQFGKFLGPFFGKMTIGRILSPPNTIIPSLHEVSFKEQGNLEGRIFGVSQYGPRVDECWVGNLLGIRLVPLSVEVPHSITQSPMSRLVIQPCTHHMHSYINLIDQYLEGKVGLCSAFGAFKKYNVVILFHIW